MKKREALMSFALFFLIPFYRRFASLGGCNIFTFTFSA